MNLPNIVSMTRDDFQTIAEAAFLVAVVAGLASAEEVQAIGALQGEPLETSAWGLLRRIQTDARRKLEFPNRSH